VSFFKGPFLLSGLSAIVLQGLPKVGTATKALAIQLVLALILLWPGPKVEGQSQAAGLPSEASGTLVGRFVIKNIYGWEGIPGGRITSGIYVTLYHPRSGKSRELTTDGKGYIYLPNTTAGIYVLKNITYLSESISGPSHLSTPLTPLTCAVSASSITYCGTVLHTFQRLPKGKEAYAGRVRPEKPGVHGLDILDESEEARKQYVGGSTRDLDFRTSLWSGPKGLPSWEAATRFYKATEYSSGRRYEEAIPLFKEGLLKDPGHAWGHFMIARAYQWQGHDDKAIAEYGRALKLQPDFAWGHFSLGILYLLQGRYPPSREEFQKAAAIDPGFVPAASYHLKKLEEIAKVQGADLESYKAASPEEESFLADAKAAINAALSMDWKTCFSYFSDDGRVEAHCGICDPSSFFSVEELKDYLTQPIAKNFRVHHVKVRVLSLKASDGKAQVTFFNSYELSKTNEEKGWWFADVSTVKANKVGGRWVLMEHQYKDHLH
jgi:tetratricopeptide (TPR) repeat protein